MNTKDVERMTEEEIESNFEIMLEDLDVCAFTGMIKSLSDERMLSIGKLLIKELDLGEKEEALKDYAKGKFDVIL